jgi:uncharacterized protein (TIGR03118 family)
MRLAGRLGESVLAAVLGVGALVPGASRAEAGPFVQTNLVSDIPGLAAITDSSLRNPWGVSHSATSPFWVSDQGTGVSTIYAVTGSGVTKAGLTVTIPTTASGPQGPTGQVNNGSGAFAVGGAPASFIFANLNGTISAWNRGLGTTAQIAATTPGAVYTGLAIDNNSARLFAANGAQNRIDVFDGSFAPVNLGTSAFKDPNLPAGLVPFNVQNIGSNIYVTYAPAGRAAQIAAPEGMGAVAVFDANGNFIRQVASGGKLAAPWGVALAPGAFGNFGGDLLVGNFSFAASEINIFSPISGALLDTITLDLGGNSPGGLWDLIFGNGGAGGDPNILYFSDGINGEANGLFGAIRAIPEPASLALVGPALAFLVLRRPGRRGSAADFRPPSNR